MLISLVLAASAATQAPVEQAMPAPDTHQAMAHHEKDAAMKDCCKDGCCEQHDAEHKADGEHGSHGEQH